MEHPRTKGRIRHIHAVLASVRHVSRLIVKEKDRERFIRRACDILVENKGYENAWIALTDEHGALRFFSQAGQGENLLVVAEKLADGERIHCCKKPLDRPGLLSLKNPWPECVSCPVFRIYKDRGTLTTRLEHGGKVYGILTVSVPAEFGQDPEEQELFMEVAADIAFALRGMEAEEKRRQAEEALRKTRDQLEHRVRKRTEELERLYSRLLHAQEEERKRIAGDLHDGIGQSLSAIKFMVETLLEQVNRKTVNILSPLVPMLQKASEEVRTIVMNLRPSMLDDLGILATLSWFCRQFRTVYAFIRVEERIDIREEDIPEPLKIVIFRVLQEAMNNVVKHSHAARVRVCLRKKGGRVELAVEDNGAGFDIAEMWSGDASKKGFGITGMKERTELSGGVFGIRSEKESGTLVRASWKHQRIP